MGRIGFNRRKYQDSPFDLPAYYDKEKGLQPEFEPTPSPTASVTPTPSVTPSSPTKVAAVVEACCCDYTQDCATVSQFVRFDYVPGMKARLWDAGAPSYLSGETSVYYDETVVDIGGVKYILNQWISPSFPLVVDVPLTVYSFDGGCSDVREDECSYDYRTVLFEDCCTGEEVLFQSNADYIVTGQTYGTYDDNCYSAIEIYPTNDPVLPVIIIDVNSNPNPCTDCIAKRDITCPSPTPTPSVTTTQTPTQTPTPSSTLTPTPTTTSSVTPTPTSTPPPSPELITFEVINCIDGHTHKVHSTINFPYGAIYYFELSNGHNGCYRISDYESGNGLDITNQPISFLDCRTCEDFNTASPTPTPSVTSTPTPEPSPTSTPAPSKTTTPTPTPSMTVTPSPTPSKPACIPISGYCIDFSAVTSQTGQLLTPFPTISVNNCDDIWASYIDDNQNKIFILHWDGNGWTDYTITKTNTIRDLNIIAIGNNEAYLTYNVFDGNFIPEVKKIVGGIVYDYSAGLSYTGSGYTHMYSVYDNATDQLYVSYSYQSSTSAHAYVEVLSGSSWTNLSGHGFVSFGENITNVSENMVLDSSGNLYVTGFFSNPEQSNVAFTFMKWDGSTWTFHSSGFLYTDFNAIPSYSLTIDNKDNMIFSEIGTTQAIPAVYRWTVNQWVQMGANLGSDNAINISLSCNENNEIYAIFFNNSSQKVELWKWNQSLVAWGVTCDNINGAYYNMDYLDDTLLVYRILGDPNSPNGIIVYDTTYNCCD